MEEKLKKKSYKVLYEEQKQLSEDLLNTLQRLQADFENFKKRIEKENNNLQKYSNQRLIANLLPILDDFENSIKHLDKTNPEELKTGFILMHQKLKQLLESEGLKEITCSGEKFDPYQHEVLLQENNEKEQGTILEEIQRGYCYKDCIIRHSKVKISKGEEKNGRK